ncbi:MAG: DUF6452 family protein [Bacteroidota bacterium]
MEHNAFLYKKSRLGVLIALIFFGLSACEEESDCITDSTNVASVEFTKLISNEGSNSEEDALDSTIVLAEGSVARLPTDRGNQTGLPLNPASNTSTFYVFRQTEEGIFTGDTIVLNYRREQTLISPECGPDQQFTDISVDTALTTFDSVLVRNPEVSRFGETVNLRIFTCRYEMTNILRLQFDYPEVEEEPNDTLFIRRIYSSIGKENLLQDTLIEQGEDIIVEVPVTLSDEQVQVFLETEGATPETYDVLAYYQRDTFQVAKCLAQDRYRIDSLRLGENPGRLEEPTEVEESTVFNINNAVNATVSIR